MPKLIENLRDQLLACAKALLLEKGYDQLAIRDVAKRCGVAVGTVYNYFRSKEVLVASVMLEDWLYAINAMKAEAAAAPAVMDGLRIVYRWLKTFADRYQAAWQQYRANISPVLQDRHRMLIGQLSEVIKPLLLRFDRLFHPYLPMFLAETLLSASIDSDSHFPELAAILSKLLQ